ARAAKAQQVELERGDTVLIRTGWGQYFGANPALYKGDFSPGPGVEGAQFLIDAGARVVGNDTLTFEQRPPILGTPGTPSFQVFPVHMLVIADHGINIIENFFLEELAEARVYEFLLVVPPLKIRGGTGSTWASPRANRARSRAAASMVTARPCTSISAMSWPAMGPCMKPWPLKPAMTCNPAAPGTALTIPV